MKINEITKGKISKIMPGQSAEVDHGDGTKTVVDLKANPNALQKDTMTGKVKLANGNSGQNKNAKATVNQNDEVEMDTV